MHKGICRATGWDAHRTKYTVGSCSSVGDGASESLHFKFCWNIKRENCNQSFNIFQNLKKKPYWADHFLFRGYCVDTVGIDTKMIRK